MWLHCDVIPKDETRLAVTDKRLSNEERLSNPVGLGLLSIGDVDAKLRAVLQGCLKVGRPLGVAILHACQHEGGKRVIDHRLVENWQQLLRDRHRAGVEPGPAAPSENYFFTNCPLRLCNQLAPL